MRGGAREGVAFTRSQQQRRSAQTAGARTCPSPRPSPHREERWERGRSLLLSAGGKCLGNPAEALSSSAAALAAHETALGAQSPTGPKDSARVTADALAALGRPDEAAALRTRYALDPPPNPKPDARASLPHRPSSGRGGAMRFAYAPYGPLRHARRPVSLTAGQSRASLLNYMKAQLRCAREGENGQPTNCRRQAYRPARRAAGRGGAGRGRAGAARTERRPKRRPVPVARRG